MDTTGDTRSTREMLKRLVALAKPEWRSLVLGALFLLIGSAMGLSYPQAIRVIIDEALGARESALAALRKRLTRLPSRFLGVCFSPSLGAAGGPPPRVQHARWRLASLDHNTISLKAARPTRATLSQNCK